MKTALLLAVTAAALTACAAAGAQTPTYSATDTTFEGWVRFTGEEFQLYATEVQARRPFARPCLSGALPRDLQRQAANDLGGKKVRVVGRTQAWSEDLPGDRIDREGSAIRNECGGAFVILGDSMSPIT